VAITATWMVLANANVHESVALSDALRLAGEIVHEVLLVARLTVNDPCWSVIAIMDVPAVPAFRVTVVGLAEIVKSWTVNVTVVWAVMLPLIPVTVTM
jgi:hypothetical protein